MQLSSWSHFGGSYTTNIDHELTGSQNMFKVMISYLVMCHLIMLTSWLSTSHEQSSDYVDFLTVNKSWSVIWLCWPLDLQQVMISHLIMLTSWPSSHDHPSDYVDLLTFKSWSVIWLYWPLDLQQVMISHLVMLTSWPLAHNQFSGYVALLTFR